MDSVHILMEEVHEPGPQRGPLDKGYMCYTFPIYTVVTVVVTIFISLLSIKVLQQGHCKGAFIGIKVRTALKVVGDG